MAIDMTKVILAIISLLGTVLTAFVIPLIKAKLNIAKAEMSENQAAMLDLFIATFCKAAEQLYRSDEGQKKKAYVLDALEQMGYDINTIEIDAGIEAFVLDLHNAMKKPE